MPPAHDAAAVEQELALGLGTWCAASRWSDGVAEKPCSRFSASPASVSGSGCGSSPVGLTRVVAIDSPLAYAWGGDAVAIDGEAVGELSSAGWSPKAGACVALGYVRGEAVRREHRGTAVVIDLYGQAVGARAWDAWPAARTK